MARSQVLSPHRVAARLAGAALDDRLAGGVPPECSRRLAARVDLLLAPRARLALARSWARLADRALERGPAVVDPRTPIAAGAVVAASEEIGRLIDVLSSERPPDVRVVALARHLLVDGGSPVYATGGGAQLRQVLADALSPGGPPSRPARTSPYREPRN